MILFRLFFLKLDVPPAGFLSVIARALLKLFLKELLFLNIPRYPVSFAVLDLFRTGSLIVTRRTDPAALPAWTRAKGLGGSGECIRGLGGRGTWLGLEEPHSGDLVSASSS